MSSVQAITMKVDCFEYKPDKLGVEQTNELWNSSLLDSVNVFYLYIP